MHNRGGPCIRKEIYQDFYGIITRKISSHRAYAPQRSSGSIKNEVIYKCALEKDKFCIGLEHYTLKGFQDMDAPLQLKDSPEKIAFWKALLKAKDTEGNRFI